MPHLHAFCSIVPPHILHRLAESDDEGLRKDARDALALTERLRGERALVGRLPSGVSPGMKRRTVYDARHGTSLPGMLVRNEDGPATEDASVEQAFRGAGDTYDFFRVVYGRNSIDDRGLRLDSSVHYAVRFDNAFWNEIGRASCRERV